MEQPSKLDGRTLLLLPKARAYGDAMTTPRQGSARAGRRRLIAQLSAESELLSTRIWQRIRAEIPLYTQRDPGELLPAIHTNVRDILLPLDEGREFTEVELAAFRSYGETRARQGIPTEEMLRAWRLSIREVFDAMITAGRQRRVSDNTLLELTRDLLSATDAATLAFTQGHHRAELELARQEQHRRADFVRGILFATLGPAQILHQAHRYGLDPGRDYHPIRAQPTRAMPMEAIERLLDLAFDSSRPHGMVALVDGDVAGFLDHPPQGKTRAAIGVGPPARLDGLEPSFRRATRAMATAAAFGMTGVYDLGSLGLLPAVLADTDVAEELTRRYITPLTTGEAMRPILETVRRYLTLGMRADLTAEHMSVHHNTVRYRLRRYEELTGMDLRDPNHALEAWWALQRTRLDTAPSTAAPAQIADDPDDVHHRAVARRPGERASSAQTQ
jgi:hypothetical protein